MELRGISCFYLILTLRLISGESLYYKVPKDHDPTKEIRGNSFGLENFLLQAYKEADTVNEDTATKRVKGKETIRQTEKFNRGQTYGLENLAPNLYDFGHSLSGQLDYNTNIKPVTELTQEFPKRRVPEVQKSSENDERRERVKVRKPVKQVVRRPVSTTKAPTTTQRNLAPQNVEIGFEEPKQYAEQTNETTAPIAEASYVVPKIQEIPGTGKEDDENTKQRPRKRVTMRRRRKRPQSSQNVDNTQTSDSRPLNEDNDAFDVQKDNTFIPAQTSSTSTTTTTTTTTLRPRTDKERPSRRKPGGFRKVPVEDFDTTQDSISKAELTTIPYRTDLDTDESNIPTTDLTDTVEYSEEPFVKSSTTTSTTTAATSISSSSEETSAADLKRILKQQNGPLSLSELLQTQNLSLADFLKNRKEAALLLSGRRGTSSTTSRPDSKENNRPSFNFKSRPFTRHRHETEEDESKSNERKSIEVTTVSSERYTYNGFVPKNPRGRNGQNKGVYPTAKTNFGSEEKPLDRGIIIKKGQQSQNIKSENSAKLVEIAKEKLNQTREELRNSPKRFNDLRLKLRIHRRKYNPHSTTNKIKKDESVESSTQPITISTTSNTPTIGERTSTPEEIPTTKRLGLRIPFKSSNNPELSLILPNKNKSEEKTEKRERYSNYSSRLHNTKKPIPEKDDSTESNNVDETTTAKISENKPNLSLDFIDMDDETETSEDLKESPDVSKEEKDKSSENKRVEAVGKIPLPNELQKYESKDEILELLKSGSTSDRLQRILESRNMTVKELLENREKSSLHTNFTQLFSENDTSQRKKNEIRTTTSVDPNFKVFQSLPDFEPVHRNLFQKNVKEVKSNSYPDSQIDESRTVSVRNRIAATTAEPRESKQLSGIVEVKKKLQLNSDSESRDSFENNDGGLDPWNIREKLLYYNNAFPKIKEKAFTTVRTNVEKLPVNDKAENEAPEPDIILLETIRRSHEANQKLKSNINEILQEQSEVREINNDMEKSFIPPAVKSAIIASGIVMGLALFVFVAIFAACGWKQRQIRLRARSSILNDALAKSDSEKKVQRTNALSPVTFKQSSVYKKTLEMDDESSTSASISSNASSYLWNTLKNTFAGRNITQKNRLEKDKIREERLEGLKSVLRSQENRRNDLLAEEDVSEETFSNPLQRHEGRFSTRKNDCIKNPNFTGSNHFSSCTHGH